MYNNTYNILTFTPIISSLVQGCWSCLKSGTCSYKRLDIFKNRNSEASHKGHTRTPPRLEIAPHRTYVFLFSLCDRCRITPLEIGDSVAPRLFCGCRLPSPGYPRSPGDIAWATVQVIFQDLHYSVENFRLMVTSRRCPHRS